MRVRWRVRGLRDRSFGDWTGLSFGRHLRMDLSGAIGPAGLDHGSRDLLAVGLASYAIERSQPARASTNRPVAIDVRIELAEPDRWSDRAVGALSELLRFQGDATWSWRMHRAHAPAGVDATSTTTDGRNVTQVVLFSGGLDSTCGLSTMARESPCTQLVSHYTRQKSLQLSVAGELGFVRPTQAWIARADGWGRGRNYFYRSAYFLCLAAAVASSFRARRVFQFENGILATAMPPSPAYFMTRHAHPLVHQHAEVLFSEILGGPWQVVNPFLGSTKRECVMLMRRAIGPTRAARLIGRTQTCWFLNSYQVRGGERKDNGKPCGICIPCIIRYTALGSTEGRFDLRDSATRKNAALSRDFDAYARMMDRIGGGRSFFLEMPDYVRGITSLQNGIQRDDLTGLFTRFSKEFRSVFSW